MKKLLSLLCYSLATLALAACTANEKKVVKELENMPGVTCTIDNNGQSHCGPDSLDATKTAYPS